MRTNPANDINEPKDAKMKEMILYVAKASEDDENFGAVKLNKILFYADFLAYLKRGQSVTGQDYFAIPEGPAPRRLVPIREQMESSGEIAVKTVKRFGFDQKRIEAKREAILENFNQQEIEDIDAVLAILKNKTGKEVTNMSHDFDGWEIAFSQGSTTSIPYSLVRFDFEGFLGIDSPSVPDSLIEYGRELSKRVAPVAA